jgi:hypothetical protein
MCAKFNLTSGRLRVAQAFIAVLSLAGSSSAPRYVSVARMGKYEIRMFNSSPSSPGDAPRLWMELFDHDAKMSIDTSSCHEIEDAVSTFEALVSQVKNLNGTFGSEGDERQV